MDALRKSGDSCGARIAVLAPRRAGGPGRAAVRQARCRHRLRDDGHQRRQGRRDRRRLRRSWRNAAASTATNSARRAFAATMPAACSAASPPGRTCVVSIAIKPTSSIRLPRASIDRAGAADHGRDPRPPRPLRRHPRHADRRGDAGAGGDGPCAAPARAERRRGAARRRRSPAARRERAAPMTAARPRCVPYGALAWFCYFAAIGRSTSATRRCGSSRSGLSALAIGAIASLQSWTRVFAPYCLGAGSPTTATRRTPLLELAGVAVALTSRWRSRWPGASASVAVASVVVLLFIANGAVMPLTEASLAHQLNLGAERRWTPPLRPHAHVGLDRFHAAPSRCSAACCSTAGIAAWPWLVIAHVRCCWRRRCGGCRATPTRRTTRPARRARWRVLRRPEVAWFFAGVFLTVLAHTSLYAFFSLYLASLGLRQERGRPAVGGGRGGRDRLLLEPGPLVRAPVAARLAAVGRAACRCCASARWPPCGGSWLRAGADADALHASPSRPSTRPASRWSRATFPAPLRGRGQALYITLGYGAVGRDRRRGRRCHHRALGFRAVFGAAALVALLATLCCWRCRSLALRAG